MRNGPITTNGITRYYLNDVLHRDDGPAMEYPDGTREWYRDDRRHREDGPAVECSSGTREWWRDGKLIDAYYPNLGCARNNITTRAEALARLDAKPRPYSRELYLADIDRLFPET